MKILVTGGAGFIGSHLVRHFHGRALVRVLDDFSSGSRRNLEGLDAEIFDGSILDRDLVRRAAEGVDHIFHLAAMVSVPASMENPAGCVETNLTGLLVVLEEAARGGVKKLCLGSSAAVYGNRPEVPKTELMTPEPRSPYAITKLSGEHFCALFAPQLETVALRFFNVYGPGQNPASAYAAVVPAFISQALADQPITIYGDGEQTRDFVFVEDVARACAFLTTTPGLTGVFNVGSGASLSVNALAQTVLAVTGSASKIRHAPSRPGDVEHSRASIEKLKAAGFAPSVSLEEGLGKTISAFRR